MPDLWLVAFKDLLPNSSPRTSLASLGTPQVVSERVDTTLEVISFSSDDEVASNYAYQYRDEVFDMASTLRNNTTTPWKNLCMLVPGVQEQTP
jgi:hypothetical protein